MDSGLDPSSLEEILNLPFMQPPPNQVANFNDPPNCNDIATLGITLCSAVATICYLMRAYTRIFCVKKARCEDCLDYIVISILYCFSNMFIKMAILLEWTHIFITRSNRNTFFWTCYIMIYASCALYMTTVITINLACTPRKRIWQRWLPGTCINIDAFNLFITSFHLVFDLFMLLLPHQIIWKLSLTTRQKVGVSMIFSVGIL
ncbi:hypothetical protein F4775DRAFT_587216 [Biscogniauxia sp. FL1348]|nr:hypothetical protein F4775DRAFT_587216 [Biscogniauxia sp. FL1348]